jgi:HEAT repeat protein
MFAPIWSARRHPIYRLIEIADEEQRLRLKPEINKLVQERVVTSRSKLSNQHQGHDAILEEINKQLKSLIPSTYVYLYSGIGKLQHVIAPNL